MGIIKRYILPIGFTALLWLYAGARFALDVVGWSTAPDDAKVALGHLERFFLWLMSIPVWMPFAGAVALSAIMILKWPKPSINIQNQSKLPKSSASNSAWADGLRAISIRDAACAFAGVTPTEWGDSSRAQAIATDLLSQTSTGFIGTPEDYISKQQGGRIVHIGRPPFAPKESVSVDTIIDVRSLAGFAQERLVDVDWLLNGNSKIFSPESIKALEAKRSRELVRR